MLLEKEVKNTAKPWNGNPFLENHEFLEENFNDRISPARQIQIHKYLRERKRNKSSP